MDRLEAESFGAYTFDPGEHTRCIAEECGIGEGLIDTMSAQVGRAVFIEYLANLSISSARA
ncbi:MAG: hypothetical protein H8K05_10965 [Nitrospira sp.]|nr:hypothetical protein [Nitrospira sp.]